MNTTQRYLPCLSFVILLFSCQFAAAAALSFSVTFQDVISGTGVGFDDPVLGTARQSELITTANRLSRHFNHPGSVVSLHILASELNGTGAPVVGQACHDVSPFTTSGGFFEPYSLLEAETGTAPSCPDGGHMNLAVDFGFAFDFDPSDGTTGWDFATVVSQGLVRGMGYGSDGVVAGGSTPYGISAYDTTRPTSFDRMSQFLFFDAGGVSPLWSSAGVYNGVPFVPLSDGDVFFHNGAPGLSFPLSLNGGTQFNYSGVITDLMAPAQEGVARSDLSVNDIAALEAIGWDVEIVPEPSSGVLAMLGLLLLLSTRRRRGR